MACTDGRHFFPESQSARAVRDALLAEALRLGVTLEHGRRVQSLAEVYPARAGAVVLATGGRSFPTTGSTGDAVRLTAELGHATVPAVPGLVGLRAANLDASLAGLVLPRARAIFRRKGRPAEVGEGELLLTHGGLSGPAVLDLSASLAEAAGEAIAVDEEDGGSEKDEADGTCSGRTPLDAAPIPPILALEWLSGSPPPSWLEKFAAWRRSAGGKDIHVLLREYFPARLARWLCAVAGVDGLTPATLTVPGRDALATALGSFPCQIIGTEGWQKAMLTRGGVSLRDIDPTAMRSRLAPWLHFAGEAVDVDGPCGGFNLHWAFASGALAGSAAADVAAACLRRRAEL